MSDFELAEVPPESIHALVVQDVITPRHVEIKEDFVSRVRNLLAHQPGKIANYGVKSARWKGDTDDETIELVYQGCTLKITLETKPGLDS